ncbi:hypothetical protein M426DRAFT_24291 [Hypoxylon sp. CI-4A]|nr:hypothetical protein M426DRAFT_24291 [Hypoxylon sp. CI-4A]
MIEAPYSPVDDYPNGYPRLGAFITRDQGHLIFRRFNWLQARVLLNLQEQLQEYEVLLNSYDSRGATATLVSEAEEITRGRDKLMQLIEDKYKRYVCFVNAASTVACRSQPQQTNYRSLEAFFQRHDPLREQESYYTHRDDLISLKPREDTSRVDTRFMKLILEAPGKVTQRLFRHPELSGHDDFMLTYSMKRIMFAKAVILGVPLIVLLVGPIYPLYSLSQGEMTERTLVGIMFIQLGFTCLFACCLKYMTRSKRHELFACTVAYMGVLLVFMSQTIQSSH